MVTEVFIPSFITIGGTQRSWTDESKKLSHPNLIIHHELLVPLSETGRKNKLIPGTYKTLINIYKN